MILKFVTRENCLVCGNPDSRELLNFSFKSRALTTFIETYYRGFFANHDFGDGRYVLRECSRCDFVWQHEVLDATGIELLYEQAIDPVQSYEKRRDAPNYFFASLLDSARRISFFSPWARPRSLKVLDYGMGWSYWCQTARALGFEVMGFELSPARRTHALNQGLRVVDRVEDISAGSLDFINMDQVLEHMTDFRETLTALCSRLKPRGIIKIGVPDSRRARRRLKDVGFSPSKDAFHPLEHVNAFNNKSLCRLMASLNFVPAQPPWRQTGFPLGIKLALKHKLTTEIYFCRSTQTRNAKES